MQKKHIINLIIIFIVVVILELTVFNINSYRVFNSKNSKTFTKEDFTYNELENNSVLIKVSNVDTEVKTVHIEIKTLEKVEYKFLYTDETTSVLTETPSKMYIQDFPNSKYIATYLSREK